ncbi:MAG: hypothetical protein ACKO3T_09060, partial [Planctomycetaceae bacterium]
SRPHLRTETIRQEAEVSAYITASMEPSSFEDGDIAGRLHDHVDGWASMEPSSFEDGDFVLVAVMTKLSVAASMEPSSFEDGDRPRRIFHENTVLRAGLRALAGKTTDNTRQNHRHTVSGCQRTTCVREH